MPSSSGRWRNSSVVLMWRVCMLTSVSLNLNLDWVTSDSYQRCYLYILGGLRRLHCYFINNCWSRVGVLWSLKEDPLVWLQRRGCLSLSKKKNVISWLVGSIGSSTSRWNQKGGRPLTDGNFSYALQSTFPHNNKTNPCRYKSEGSVCMQ